MKGTISEKGQITIPKKFRNSLGLTPGTSLDFQEFDGKLVIVKKETADKITQWRGAGKLPFGENTQDYIDTLRNR